MNAKQDALESEFLSLTLEQYKLIREEIELLRSDRARYRNLAVEFKNELDDAERSIDDLKALIVRMQTDKPANEQGNAPRNGASKGEAV